MDEALIKRVPPHSIEAEQSDLVWSDTDGPGCDYSSLPRSSVETTFIKRAYGVIFDSVIELLMRENPLT